MNIKCIALDLDRTTLSASGRLSDGNYNALCHAIENGVHIVIASGRSFDTLPKDVLAVPGIEYAITSNGAAIYHIPTSTCLHEYKMTPASVECIIQIAKQHETALEVFIDGKAYALKAYVEDPVSYGTTPQAIPYIQSTRIPIDDIISFIREHIDLITIIFKFIPNELLLLLARDNNIHTVNMINMFSNKRNNIINRNSFSSCTL